MLLFALLAGCSCDVDLPTLSACIGPSDGELEPGDLVLSVAGEVAEAGRGIPAGSCMEGEQRLGTPPTAFQEPDTRWFRMVAEDRSWTAVVFAEAASLSPQRQDLVAVEFSRVLDLEGQPRARFEVRGDERGLNVWMQEAGSVAELDPPEELQLEEGRLACLGRCGGGEHDVVFSTEGASGTLEPGHDGVLEGWRAVHAGASSGCEGEGKALLALVE